MPIKDPLTFADLANTATMIDQNVPVTYTTTTSIPVTYTTTGTYGTGSLTIGPNCYYKKYSKRICITGTLKALDLDSFFSQLEKQKEKILKFNFEQFNTIKKFKTRKKVTKLISNYLALSQEVDLLISNMINIYLPLPCDNIYELREFLLDISLGHLLQDYISKEEHLTLMKPYFILLMSSEERQENENK